jgi:hypothetical protein
MDMYANLDVKHKAHGLFEKMTSEMTEKSEAKDDERKTMK